MQDGRWLDSSFAKRLHDPKVHVGLKRLFVACIHHIGFQSKPYRDQVLLHDLVHQNHHRLGQMHVAT
jgi:hypothetical protein